MKRILVLLIALFFVLPTPVKAYSAASYALYDPLTDRVLAQRNMDTRRGMASTTKLMTALVAAERYDPDKTIKIDKTWCGIEGSSIYLQPGESVTIRELLYGLLLCSGNDAATALAGLGGNPAGFVARMNERAVELSMLNTHFDNPSGLDGDTHYSTAYDLCLLAQAVLEVPLLRQIVGTRSAHIGGRWMTNHNRLLAYNGIIGLKTGYTKTCGRCLVSAMEQNGRTLIAVTLGDPDDWNDHLALYETAFEGMERRNLVEAGAHWRTAVAGIGTCNLYVNERFELSLLAEELNAVTVRLRGPRLCYPNICAGEQWGTLRVELNGSLLFETAVYFESDFAAPQPGFWERMWQNLMHNRSQK